MKRKLVIYTVLVVVAVIVAIGMVNFNDHNYIVTITGKERVNKDDSSKYMIFAEDEKGKAHTFENTDTLLRFKFNSSDYYARLEVGKKYKIKVIGHRIPLLSKYENIIRINPIE